MIVFSLTLGSTLSHTYMLCDKIFFHVVDTLEFSVARWNWSVCFVDSCLYIFYTSLLSCLTRPPGRRGGGPAGGAPAAFGPACVFSAQPACWPAVSVEPLLCYGKAQRKFGCHAYRDTAHEVACWSELYFTCIIFSRTLPLSLAVYELTF